MLEQLQLAVGPLSKHGRAEGLHDLLDGDILVGELVASRAEEGGVSNASARGPGRAAFRDAYHTRPKAPMPTGCRSEYLCRAAESARVSCREQEENCATTESKTSGQDPESSKRRASWLSKKGTMARASLPRGDLERRAKDLGADEFGHGVVAGGGCGVALRCCVGRQILGIERPKCGLCCLPLLPQFDARWRVSLRMCRRESVSVARSRESAAMMRNRQIRQEVIVGGKRMLCRFAREKVIKGGRLV